MLRCALQFDLDRVFDGYRPSFWMCVRVIIDHCGCGVRFTGSGPTGNENGAVRRVKHGDEHRDLVGRQTELSQRSRLLMRGLQSDCRLGTEYGRIELKAHR